MLTLKTKCGEIACLSSHVNNRIEIVQNCTGFALGDYFSKPPCVLKGDDVCFLYIYPAKVILYVRLHVETNTQQRIVI